MLMIACVVVWPLASGHYGCPQANTKAIPLQATINLIIICFGATLKMGGHNASEGSARKGMGGGIPHGTLTRVTQASY